jgi:hypothetical protein
MSNINNLKPWFREDLTRVLISIYFTSLVSQPVNETNRDYRDGFAAAISSVAIGLGINPESLLTNNDLMSLRATTRQLSD